MIIEGWRFYLELLNKPIMWTICNQCCTTTQVLLLIPFVLTWAQVEIA